MIGHIPVSKPLVSKNKRHPGWAVSLFIFALLFLVTACAPAQPSAVTPTPTAATPTSTATPLPTVTFTPQPSPVPAYPLTYFSENAIYSYDFQVNRSTPFTEVNPFLLNDASAAQMALSPDGVNLAFDGSDPQIGCPTFREVQDCWLTGPNGYFVFNTSTHLVDLLAPFAWTNMSWSPSGDRLVFAQLIYDTKLFQTKLLVKPVNEGESTQITSGEAVDQYPAWSPDGEWIAFYRYPAPPPGLPLCTHAPGFYDDCYDRSLYIVHPDGSGLTLLLKNARVAQTEYNMPAWSPDGKKIAIFAGRSPTELTLVDVPSGKVTILPGLMGSSNTPVWSPDGSMLAMTSQVNGSPQVIIISPDGKIIRVLAPDLTYSRYPAWSPDGKWVAFIGQVSNQLPRIMVASVDGQTLITLHTGFIRSRPAWLSNNP